MVSEYDFDEDLSGKKAPDNTIKPIKSLRDVATELMKQYSFATTTKDEELFCYDSGRGIYVPDQEWLIKRESRRLLPSIDFHDIREVISIIKDSTYVDRSLFDSNPDLINLQNGYLNIHTNEFKEHSPQQYFLSVVPINYNQTAKCPRFAKFLSQILKAKDIPIMLELIGYCFYRSAKFEKAILCIGKGDNGKSTLLKALEYCVGDENTSNATLQDLSGGDKFASADLYGKLINTFADLRSDKITKGGSGKFKALVSGDRGAAQKKYGQRFFFRNHAKLIFSCNDIPESDDDGYAYFKRWIIFHFERVFTGEDKDVNLIDKMRTEEEKSGILNLALTGLKRLIDNGGFVGSDDIETVRDDYIGNSADIGRFIEDKCIITKNIEDSIICRDLWGIYLSYCKDKGITSKDDKTFGMELMAKHVTKKQLMMDYDRAYYYVGVKLKEFFT